jgi:hypothetical protein
MIAGSQPGARRADLNRADIGVGYAAADDKAPAFLVAMPPELRSPSTEFSGVIFTVASGFLLKPRAGLAARL